MGSGGEVEGWAGGTVAFGGVGGGGGVDRDGCFLLEGGGGCKDG